MCRQMITGVGITSGIFLLSLNEGASLSCPFPMQRFPVGHGINCPWHAKRKNTFTCKITQNLFNLRLIFKWLNIMGYPRITVASLPFQLNFTDIPLRESFATVFHAVTFNAIENPKDLKMGGLQHRRLWELCL